MIPSSFMKSFYSCRETQNRGSSQVDGEWFIQTGSFKNCFINSADIQFNMTLSQSVSVCLFMFITVNTFKENESWIIFGSINNNEKQVWGLISR